MNLDVVTREELDQMAKSIITAIKEILQDSGKSNNTKLYTNTEACQYLNICSKTLQNYRDNGLIEFTQIGRKIFYLQSDLNNFILNYKKGVFKKDIVKL